MAVGLTCVQKAILEPPSKFVETEVEVQMACRLLFVDMEGLNDSRAVKTIVPKVNPRKMVCYSVCSCLRSTELSSDHRARYFGCGRLTH